MIVGVLLAAGGARRFGSQKLLAPLDGQPLVRHAAEALASVTDEMLAVVGCEAAAVRGALEGTGVVVVENPAWETGLSSSLRRGIESLPETAQAAVVALGDQPWIGAEIFTRVVDVWRSSGAAIVAARYQGVRGHPVLFDRSVFAELLSTTGDAGAKGLIERTPERVAYVDVDGAMPRDVDVPSDLAALGAVHSPRNARGGNVEPH